MTCRRDRSLDIDQVRLKLEVKMEMEPSRMTRLEALVNELLKDEPCNKTVKTMMKQTGIEYSADPVEQINLVLRALHFEIDETPAAAKGNA